METIIATILATVLITVAVIGLGLMAWAIVSLKRKVSKLGGLCAGLQSQLDGVHREFENVDRDHNQNINDVRNDMVREFDGVHRRIDETINEFEKQLDKRFDNVYRKLPKINQEPTGSETQNA